MLRRVLHNILINMGGIWLSIPVRRYMLCCLLYNISKNMVSIWASGDYSLGGGESAQNSQHSKHIPHVGWAGVLPTPLALLGG